MQQVSLYISGERDYPLIKGSTGPLVYPAAHVYIYTLLYHVTDQGRDILLGQTIFAGLYLATLAVVVSCYRQTGAPPYLFPLLVLSKRLHSIFVLRLFNDGVAAFAMWVAIYLCLKRRWTAGIAMWSAGVAVKMTLVLLVPAIAAITLLSLGLTQSIVLGAMAILVQVCCRLSNCSRLKALSNVTKNRFCLQCPSFRLMLRVTYLELSSYPDSSCSNGR